MFIQTEATPNPATLKFIPGREVSPGAPIDFASSQEAHRSPLAAALFSLGGVERVMFGDVFIAVTKSDGEWQHLKPSVLGVIMEHMVSGAPLIAEGAQAPAEDEEFIDAGTEDLVVQIKELLDSRIRPAVASDGGDITFRGFRGGIVYLSMKGACSGCPSSSATLKSGVENLLRHYVPEVESVEQI